MAKSFLHNSILAIVLILVAVSFTCSAKASSQKGISPSGKQLAMSLMQKAKLAVVSGNLKQAESLWKQAKSIDSSLTALAWLNSCSIMPKEYLFADDEAIFAEKLRKMPYSNAKVELDKRLFFNPNNNKLRMLFLELAESNLDGLEVARHRKILGLQPVNIKNVTTKFKFILTVLVSILIICELKIIFGSNTNKAPMLETNI